MFSSLPFGLKSNQLFAVFTDFVIALCVSVVVRRRTCGWSALTFLMTAPLFSKRIVFQQTPSKEEENEDLFGRRHRILISLSNLLFSVSGQKINCIKRWRLKIWLFVARCYFLKQTLFVTWCYFSFDVNALCTFDVRKALLVAPLLFVLVSWCLCVVILSSSSVYLWCYHQHFC